MATKLSNVHLNIILEKSKAYNILDTYIYLAHVSTEINGKFLIQTYNDNKCDLINIIKKYMNVSYRTIHNNITELIELGILNYCDDLSAWTLIDMEKMVQTKCTKSINSQKDFLGYVNIREFFLTPNFHNMKFAEKRCMIYLAKLSDSKNSKNYKDFIMNLSKSSSKWRKILRTTSKYYARKVVTKLLNNHKDLFIDTSDNLRVNDLAPKTIKNFKFSFKCEKINKINNSNSEYDLIKLLNPKEFELIKEKIKFSNITLSKTKIMHIVRAISTIKEWFLKERIATIIINKYIAIQIHQSRENIKSLPAYLVAITKSVVNEYNILKENIVSKTKTISSSYLDNDLFSSEFDYDSLTSVLDSI